MQLEHRFTVPVPPEVAWAALLDPERVTPCFPGATLQSVDGPEFTGTVKVRLGPVALLYKGKGVFTQTDDEGRRTVIEASGRDSRGNSTAAAKVAVKVDPVGDGTAVRLVTDLTVTGRPAQLGRGLIADVGARIVTTFAECLAERLGPAHDDVTAGPGSTGSPEPTGPVGGGSTGSVGSTGNGGSAGGRDGSRERGNGTAGMRTEANGVGPGAAVVRRSRPPADQPAPAASEINLIEVAGAPVLKRLLPVIAFGVVVLVLVRRWVRGRR